MISRVVRPAVAASRSAVSARRLSGSRWAVGSSRTSTAGSASSARARASRCRCPPDSAAAVRPDRGVPAERQRGDPVQQPGAPGGRGQLGVAGLRPGQPQVVPDRRVEDVRVCRAAADHRTDVVGVVSGQVTAVQQHGARAEIDEPEQDRGHRGLSRAGGPDERDPPPRQQIKIDIPNGRWRVRRIPDRGAPDGDLHRPGRRRERMVRVAHRVRRVQHARDPPGRGPGLAELERGRGQGGDRLEGGQRGQRDHGQRHPAQGSRPGDRHAEQQDTPQGQADSRRHPGRRRGRTRTPTAGRAGSARRPRRGSGPGPPPPRRTRAARPRRPAGR